MESWRDLEGQSRGYGINSLQTVPCHFAGIVLLEDKLVSSCPIDCQAIWVMDFIHIALAFVSEPRIANKINKPLQYRTVLSKAQGGLFYHEYMTDVNHA